MFDCDEKFQKLSKDCTETYEYLNNLRKLGKYPMSIYEFKSNIAQGTINENERVIYVQLDEPNQDLRSILRIDYSSNSAKIEPTIFLTAE